MMRYTTLYEDEDLIVVNKPPGLLVIEDRYDKSLPCLKNILENKYGKVYTVHRIDQYSSGAIVFSKNDTSHRNLSLQFQDNSVVKIYLALVNGYPSSEILFISYPLAPHPRKKGMMVKSDKGKACLTEIIDREQLGKYGLLTLRLHTGRTHQIRAHLSEIGNPVVSDPIYGDGKPFFLSNIKPRKFNLKKESEEWPLLGRHGLHSYSLEFNHPLDSGKIISVNADLPKDMKAVLNQLRKHFK